MLHLKPVDENNIYEKDSVKIVNDFDKTIYNRFTIKGFRDLLDLLVNEGYGDCSFSIGYDCNCAATCPSDVVNFDDNHITFQEGQYGC